MATEQVFIGLGANLNEPRQQIIDALECIKRVSQLSLIRYSSLYGSKPLGPQEQPDYVNAVALIETTLEPIELLRALQAIEKHQGRVRKAQRWGARTLDLDIILFGQLLIETEELTVPHYHFHQREFVLYPLAEIAPNLILPDGRSLQSLIKKTSRNGLTVLQEGAGLPITL